MNHTRHDTLFSIRYAVRLHERGAALWGKTAMGLKFLSVLSGSAALVAVIGTATQPAITLGLVFALFQALEIALNPADKKYEALAQRQGFARLYAKQQTMSDEALHTAYWELVEDDTTSYLPAVKELAYNDVVREEGNDESYCYPANHPFLALLT
jgi:hypothetical protein